MSDETTMDVEQNGQKAIMKTMDGDCDDDEQQFHLQWHYRTICIRELCNNGM
jgi:hypothetical protein